MTIRNGSFVLEHLKSMHHLDHVGYNIGAAMTCILPLAQRVYTGDEDGRVVSVAKVPETCLKIITVGLTIGFYI